MSNLVAALQEQLSKGWDAGDKERYVGTFARDCEIVALGMTMSGPEQLSEMFTAFHAAFTENRHVIVSSVESGNCVAAEVEWTARHTGTFFSPNGEIPATNKVVVWRICEFDWFEDGKIVKLHSYGDQNELISQLHNG
ncbi:nuclear transport factor 2 family protein [Rhodococcus sp. T2V]|uniref:ester cyclase n=1 Tax=Rhodococcus sp. T2V TaxID=3034164 RepID=UPI0023E29DBC|nr:nuclear transport factor 2 family protein [Rhodococcus sp. T2V]MDF3312202.1 nuclear transport factor 2 family protein [Rhodococcus sp. T2V]